MPKKESKFCNADVYHHSVDKKHTNAKLIGFSWNIHVSTLKELGVILWRSLTKRFFCNTKSHAMLVNPHTMQN